MEETQEAPLSDAVYTDIVRTVQHNIEQHISPHDDAFGEQWEEYRTQGETVADAFVDEYVDEMAAYLGEHHVRAYEEHDLKQLARCASAFATVYDVLFDVSEEDAIEAGRYDAAALYQHDIIEDDLENVDNWEHEFARPQLPDGWRTISGIMEHPGWDIVDELYTAKARRLNIPESYGPAMGRFIQLHTAVKESENEYPYDTALERTDDGGIRIKNRRHLLRHQKERGLAARLWKEMRDEAVRSQILMYGVLVDDQEVLHNKVAKPFVRAVDAHDMHTEEKQWENRERMADVHATVLSSILADRTRSWERER